MSGMEVCVQVCSEANPREPRACTHPHLTHTCTHSTTHSPTPLTCGICESHLPSHKLEGQEIVLLIQAPIVEQ